MYLEGVVCTISALEVGNSVAARSLSVCKREGVSPVPPRYLMKWKDGYIQTSLEGMKKYMASLLILELPPTVS